MLCQSKGVRYSLGSSLLMTSIVSRAIGSLSMLGAIDPTGISLNRLALLSWESQRRILLKQLETLGMVHVPTCLGGPGLVWRYMVPDLPGPALAHHRLELGLAFLRASLDHLRIGHFGLVLGIDWRLQLGIRRGLYQRVLPHHPPRLPMSCRSLPSAALSLFSWESISKFMLRNFTRKLELSILPLISSCRTLPGVLSNQTEQTGSIKG
jgi:hypothetical protein